MKIIKLFKSHNPSLIQTILISAISSRSYLMSRNKDSDMMLIKMSKVALFMNFFNIVAIDSPIFLLKNSLLI